MDERRAPPHDKEADEPLGPMTPDDETELGTRPRRTTRSARTTCPLDHPGRDEAERQAGGEDGTTHGNV